MADSASVLLLDVKRHEDNMAPLGTMVSGLLHCGRAVSVRNNLGEYFGASADDLVLVKPVGGVFNAMRRCVGPIQTTDGQMDISYVYLPVLINELGLEDVMEARCLLRSVREDPATGHLQEPMARQAGLAESDISIGDYLMTRFVRSWAPEVVAVGPRELLLDLGGRIDLARVLQKVDDVFRALHSPLPMAVQVFRVPPEFKELLQAHVSQDHDELVTQWGWLSHNSQAEVQAGLSATTSPFSLMVGPLSTFI